MLPSYGWTILTNAIVTRLVNLYSVLRIAKTHNSLFGTVRTGPGEFTNKLVNAHGVRRGGRISPACLFENARFPAKPFHPGTHAGGLRTRSITKFTQF